MNQTPRELDAFLRECLGESFEVDPLPGDASARAYYRVSTPRGERYMVAYYPEGVRPDLAHFVDAYRALADANPVPRIMRHGACAIVQQDVGDVTLFEILETDPERGLRLYRRAIDVLVAFQRTADAAAAINPPFTAGDFRRELEMTREFWVERMCGVTQPATLAALDALFQRLSERIASHPYVLCHRDYHGQNLHIINDGIYVIDYQDMRRGPDTYDLASLLRDRGVARTLGSRAEDDLIEYYRARTAGDAQQRKRYFETLLQRSVKIVGTFARQSITRGRHHYLAYIPPTLESIRVCIAELPDYRELLGTFPLAWSEARPPLVVES
ncbi:MAG: aminoglycoside phosphotransferase family protein [Thermoanaerobaculia bacterium]